MATKTFVVAYGANIGSLNTLEFSCEADEANFTAKIVKIQPAKVDEKDATAATYEAVPLAKLGNLAFVEYKTDVDEQSEKAIHKAKGDTFLIKGEAFVKGKRTKVLVFREKN
jgi:hypothetical protein